MGALARTISAMKQMAVNNPMPGPDSSPKAGAWLRAIGVLVLLLGLGGAGLVYWTGDPPDDLSDDVSTARTSKKLARDIEINVGKMGLFMNDLLENWQDPGTQALTIIVASVLVASGCFYFTRLQVRRDESDGPTGRTGCYVERFS
jgi:hypothetical protein